MIQSLETLFVENSQVEHIPYLIRLKETMMADAYRPSAQNETDWDAWHKMYCSEQYFQDLFNADNISLHHIGTFREPAAMMVIHKHAGWIEIDDLLVCDTKKGYGRRLIKSALARADAWGIEKIVVDLYPGYTKSEAFLDRHGFLLEGPSSNDLGMPMHRYLRIG